MSYRWRAVGHDDDAEGSAHEESAWTWDIAQAKAWADEMRADPVPYDEVFVEGQEVVTRHGTPFRLRPEGELVPDSEFLECPATTAPQDPSAGMPYIDSPAGTAEPRHTDAQEGTA